MTEGDKIKAIISELGEQVRVFVDALEAERNDTYNLRLEATDDQKVIDDLRSEVKHLKVQLHDAQVAAETQRKLRYDDDGWSYEGKVHYLRQTVSSLTAWLRQYENCDWPADATETPLEVISRLSQEVIDLKSRQEGDDRRKAQLSAIWNVFSNTWWENQRKERT